MPRISLSPSKINELNELDENGDVLKELISLFLPSFETKHEMLKKALSASDTTRVKAIAHELRSSCANLGAEILSDFATQLEYLPVDSDYAKNARVLVDKMEEEYNLVKGKLQSFQ